MIVDDVDVSGHVFGSVGSALGSPNIVTNKVYMRTSTSSGNDRYGAKQNMTKSGAKQNMKKSWHQTEHDKKEKWR